ncbi:sec-independent protein translocase protein TatA [Fodinibius salinus]|uniref:Sec-independent protein translocase protein TatA n=1 Tax=Fodinibius salinus TaxID=860790 RepID=A0A5D3YGH0_9BACT|nr:twin-arginine translocase TatA/TatE family subunit [Fodinibius salinus]TYP92783.1 sec-independent protein translocase protein TatA [Fodinibius salinus]
MTFGAPEIILILLVILLFFGAKKIPELARGIGQGITEFQNVTEDDEQQEVEGNTQESNKQT